jgi:hypothetical protein
MCANNLNSKKKPKFELKLPCGYELFSKEFLKAGKVHSIFGNNLTEYWD